MVTDEIDDRQEDSTITGGVVVIAVVDMWDMQICPKHANTQGSQPMSGGCQTYGEAFPIWGRCPACKGGVQHVRGPLQPPQYADASQNIQMHRVYGDILGVFAPHGGIWTYRGHTNYGGHPDAPKYKNIPVTKEVRKTYLKLNSYT